MNKSYKQFSLTTLQLPAPSSNLTKAEYKDTYGIDLDEVNIPSFKLVVYGNDKFPIDQIKEVEDGYEIYFNGRILSITDTIETSNEVYDVANSKPIYYHGILLQSKTAGSLYTLCLKILNNSDTPINSWAKLLAIFNQWGSNALIEVNGFYNYDSEEIVNTAFMYVGDTTLSLVGNKNDCTRVNLAKSFGSWTAIFSEEGSVVEDRVNKIN